MEHGCAQLTVFFEGPFWVGLYEREDGGGYQASRIVFGPEPRDGEVYGWLTACWHRLRFSPSMGASAPVSRRENPKRVQRSVRRQMEKAPLETRAQQALKLQQEQGKACRRRRSREEREAEKERRFSLRQQKQREKHRGH